MKTPKLVELKGNASTEIELVYKDASHQDNYFAVDGKTIYPNHMALYR